MTRYTAQTFPAARALSILSAIRYGERLAPAPLTVSTAERNTPDDEILSWLTFAPLTVLQPTAAPPPAPLLRTSPSPLTVITMRLTRLKTLNNFFSESGRNDLIAAAIDDLNDALDTYADDPEEAAALSLGDVSFDCLEDTIKSETESMTEALDIKKYFDEDGAASGAYVLIECGGPTLYFHWLDSAGAYITATGRTTGGSATREITGEDLEIINQLYFFGELSI